MEEEVLEQFVLDMCNGQDKTAPYRGNPPQLFHKDDVHPKQPNALQVDYLMKRWAIQRANLSFTVASKVPDSGVK